MNDLATQNKQLPDTIEDLSKFVIIEKEKLKAIKAAISAIEKVGLAREVYQQKLTEAQELAEVVTEAEVRLGKLLKAIPKQAGGVNQYNKDDFSRRAEKSKTATTESLGFCKNQVSDFQRMADNPEAVERAKAKARDEDRVLSHKDVMEQIRFGKQLQVIEESGTERQKEQARSGERAISDVYREIRKSEQPKLPTAQEYRQELHERHETFKESKTVTLKDVTQDKKDRELLSDEIKKVILKAISPVFALYTMINQKEIDMSMLSDAAKKQAIGHLYLTIEGVQKIIKELEGLS